MNVVDCIYWIAKIVLTFNQLNHFSEICGPMCFEFRSGEWCFDTNGAIVICQMSNVIMALKLLKWNFSEFCGLFSYQALLRILILCLCNKQLIFFRNMFLKGPLGFFSMQNPHQKILIRAVYACAGGFDILKFDKNSLLMVFHISIWWAWNFVWGAKPIKVLRRNGTASMSSQNRVLKIVEYSTSCSLMEYCYSSFSLRQEFFISLGQNIVF